MPRVNEGQELDALEQHHASGAWLHAQETEQLLRLVGDIYDAVLEPASWPNVLKRCSAFLPGHAAALFAKGARGGAGNVYYDDGGIDPSFRESYFAKYVDFDPSNTVQYFAEIEKPVSTTDCLPYSEFLETRFYKEWVRPQNLVDCVNVQLERSPASAAMFGIFRHERHGLVDEEAKGRMRLLAPHVRRAVAIGRLVEFKAAEAATLADSLDMISAAMILVDPARKVTHMNAAAQAMLLERDMLEVVSGRLLTTDKSMARALHEIIEATGGGDGAVGSKGVAISMAARTGGRYIAHILPLTSGARRRAGLEYSASAAVFVRKADIDPPSQPQVMAQLYGLTPAELRVLLAVFETGSIDDIANGLGISVPTVKTHLRRLFDKTGTRRQTDLVKLVSGHAASNP